MTVTIEKMPLKRLIVVNDLWHANVENAGHVSLTLWHVKRPRVAPAWRPVEPRETLLMKPMTGAAALHVLLLRVWWAGDEYEVFGWTPHTRFTRQDVECRFKAMTEVLDNYMMLLVVERAERAVVVAHNVLMHKLET